jgi:uncharacterized membrane protein YhaH (DUF805 family)
MLKTLLEDASSLCEILVGHNQNGNHLCISYAVINISLLCLSGSENANKYGETDAFKRSYASR